jgi:hypothetical protein
MIETDHPAESVGKDEKKAEGGSDEKQRAAREKNRKDQTAFARGKSGKKKFRNKVEDERKRKNEAGNQTGLEHHGKGVHDLERPEKGFDLLPLLFGHVPKRPLQIEKEFAGEDATQGHGHGEGDDGFDDHFPEIFQMIEERLGFVVQELHSEKASGKWG